MDCTEKKLAVIIDGSSYIYRAYYAVAQTIECNGISVGAVYGFCSMIIPLIEKHKDDLFVVVFDYGKETFRSDIYSEYKKNRKPTPEDLKAQFPILREACVAFGLPIVEKQGFEADDIIATYAKKLTETGCNVMIYSSDKDLMQLIDDNVSLFDPKKSTIINKDEVFEKFGVTPEAMIFFQALMGDSCDNIPGVSGVGLKTAAKLVNAFKNVDDIYENIHLVTPAKIQKKLIDEKEQLYLSQKLVTLVTDMDVEVDVAKLRISKNKDKTNEFLISYDFEKLINRASKAFDF